jgi:hypothetical protein
MGRRGSVRPQHVFSPQSGIYFSIAFSNKRGTMKRSMLFAALILFFSLPVHAQSHMSLSGGNANSASPSNGGGGGGGGGYSSGGGGGSGITALPSSPRAQFSYGYAHGSDADFAPSSFLSYDDAVKLGESVLAAKPRSLGEVAAEYRASKRKAI